MHLPAQRPKYVFTMCWPGGADIDTATALFTIVEITQGSICLLTKHCKLLLEGWLIVWEREQKRKGNLSQFNIFQWSFIINLWAFFIVNCNVKGNFYLFLAISVVFLPGKPQQTSQRQSEGGQPNCHGSCKTTTVARQQLPPQQEQKSNWTLMILSTNTLDCWRLLDILLWLITQESDCKNTQNSSVHLG